MCVNKFCTNNHDFFYSYSHTLQPFNSFLKRIMLMSIPRKGIGQKIIYGNNSLSLSIYYYALIVSYGTSIPEYVKLNVDGSFCVDDSSMGVRS